MQVLMHYLPAAGLLDAEGIAGRLARQDRWLPKIYNLSESVDVSNGVAHCKNTSAFQV